MRRTRKWVRPIFILSVGCALFVSGIEFYLKRRINTPTAITTTTANNNTTHSNHQGDDLKRSEYLKKYSAQLGSLVEKMVAFFKSGTQSGAIQRSSAGESQKVRMSIQFQLKPDQIRSIAKNPVHNDLDHKELEQRDEEISTQDIENSTSEKLASIQLGEKNGICQQYEVFGFGFQNAQVSQKEWKKAVSQMDHARQLIKHWIDDNKNKISTKSIESMENQLAGLRMVRPPSLEEPDLSWRGIGIWARNEAGFSEMRLSRGFVKWVNTDPKRGLFEMTRLVAQALSPCELKRMGVESPWKPLLKCLEVQDAQGCLAGSYSEEGWAVSSSLASVLAPPGCRLPALISSQMQKCLKSFIGNERNEEI